MPDKPIQHTPKHLQDGDVFDRRHPAASSFAPLQPAAGVVADDVEERGQNLNGGPKAEVAQKEHEDQREKLVENYERDLREKAGVPAGAPVKLEGDTAKPAGSSRGGSVEQQKK